MDLEYTALQTNLAYLKKLTTFTDISINIRNHKVLNLLKTGLNVCGPRNYRLNAINKYQ